MRAEVVMPQGGTFRRIMAPRLHLYTVSPRRSRLALAHSVSDLRMRHDRRGLTVLSLLIILIVVVLLIVILFRARSPVEETASLPEAPYPTAPEVEESAMLSSIIAPDSSVQVADSDTVAVRLTNSAEAPLVGITVRFEVTAGNGTVSPETVRTDSTGIAAAVWTYGAV